MNVKRNTVVKTLSGLYRLVQFPWTQMLPVRCGRHSSTPRVWRRHRKKEHGNGRNRRSCVFSYLSAVCRIEVSHLTAPWLALSVTFLAQGREFPVVANCCDTHSTRELQSTGWSCVCLLYVIIRWHSVQYAVRYHLLDLSHKLLRIN
jgi:hypothetical protein